jgi:cytochrome oxidase Cu insertion factor (SCO1/SenC/PrrC family)
MLAGLVVAAALAAAVTTHARPLPSILLIDERGHVVKLDQIRGKILIITFFSSDSVASNCTAVAGKFLYLQRHLPSSEYRLVQITRNPVHDSPQRLAKYARQYGADPSIWTFLTGDPREIGKLARALGAPKARVGSDEPLVIIDQHGIVVGVLRDADWSPEDALALARSVTPAR